MSDAETARRAGLERAYLRGWRDGLDEAAAFLSRAADRMTRSQDLSEGAGDAADREIRRWLAIGGIDAVRVLAEDVLSIRGD